MMLSTEDNEINQAKIYKAKVKSNETAVMWGVWST